MFVLKLITGSNVFNMKILYADADDPAGDMLASARVMTERILQKWSWQGGLCRRAASLFSCGSYCGDSRKPTIRLSQLAGNTKETCLPLKVRALPTCWKFTLHFEISIDIYFYFMFSFYSLQLYPHLQKFLFFLHFIHLLIYYSLLRTSVRPLFSSMKSVAKKYGK